MKNAILVIVVIVLIAIIYFVWKNNQKKKLTAPAGSGASTANRISSGVSTTNSSACPPGYVKIGDGSACRIPDSSTICSLWGNPGVSKCYDASGNMIAPTQANSVTTVVPTGTNSIPPVVDGASLLNASCVNTSQIQNLIIAFKESKAWQIPLRMEIKETVYAICPEAMRYLTRD